MSVPARECSETRAQSKNPDYPSVFKVVLTNLCAFAAQTASYNPQSRQFCALISAIGRLRWHLGELAALQALLRPPGRSSTNFGRVLAEFWSCFCRFFSRLKFRIVQFGRVDSILRRQDMREKPRMRGFRGRQEFFKSPQSHVLTSRMLLSFPIILPPVLWFSHSISHPPFARWSTQKNRGSGGSGKTTQYAPFGVDGGIPGMQAPSSKLEIVRCNWHQYA